MQTPIERRPAYLVLACLSIALILPAVGVYGAPRVDNPEHPMESPSTSIHPKAGDAGMTVEPSDGTIGSQITITGSGFGAKKPRVLVGTAALKVEIWSDSSIQGTLKKVLAPAMYPVTVVVKDPRAAPAITAPGEFTVRLPEISTKDPAGVVNQEVTLTGRYFGTKKGRVEFEAGGKLVSAKVKHWNMNPRDGTSELRFLVPKRLAVGAYRLRVTNSVGSGWVLFAVTTALPSEIMGTVRINGWTGDASQIGIQALPITVRSSDGRDDTPDPRAPVQSGQLVRTTDPRLFLLSIAGLDPHTPYKLRITVPPNPERLSEPIKTFWSRLPGGIATSGTPPVAIEGYVANTEIEVKDGNGNWVGADDLQYTDPEAALRTLRWKSTIRGVVAGELQISLSPYPTKGDFGPCDEPEGGIIYRQQFTMGEGDWQQIGNLDFGNILAPRRLPSDDVPPGIVPSDYRPVGSSPTDDRTTGDSTNVSPVSELDLKMLAVGAPVYVRVVPVTERGRACDIKEDGVHGWVVLAKLPKSGFVAPPEPQPTPEVSHLEVVNQTYTPPVINTWGDGYRKKGLVVYKFIKDHKLPPCKTADYYAGKAGCNSKGGFPDWLSYEYNKTTGNWDKVHKYDTLGQALIDAKDSWAKPDQIVTPKLPSGEPWLFVYWIEYGSCDWWCGAWDFTSGFVTGFVNGVGGFVNWWSQAFESIKDGVASVVADVVQVLPGVGQLCKAAANVASCKSIIKAGMEYGLASMGLPPSLPNWEQLKAQGMDYLKSELSQQIASATGLPPDLASLALDEAKAMELSAGMAKTTIEAMTEKQGKAFNGWGANWVLPFDGMEPASRTIKVMKKYAGGPPYAPFPLPSNLYLKTEGFGSFIDLWVTGSLDPFIGNLYRPVAVHVPEFPPVPLIIDGKGASMNIPIVLQPDYSTIPAPECLDMWPSYDVQCTPVHVFSGTSNSPQCFKSDGYSTFKPVDCKNYETHIAIYYRNYWIEDRLDDLEYFECLRLSAVAYTLNGWFGPWQLFDPPFGTWAFTPSEEAKAWNGPFYMDDKCK